MFQSEDLKLYLKEILSKNTSNNYYVSSRKKYIGLLLGSFVFCLYIVHAPCRRLKFMTIIKKIDNTILNAHLAIITHNPRYVRNLLPKCNSNARCCDISALVLNCFRLKNCRATFFRLETIVESFLNSMVLLPKNLFNHF